MHLENELYSIDIAYGPEDPRDPGAGFAYDYRIDVVEYQEFNRTLLLSIQEKERAWKLWLICPHHTYTHDIAILEGHELVLAMEDIVLRIDLQIRKVINRIVLVDLWVPIIFAIYPHGTEYIVHGETEIVKLTHDFQQEWCFGARDIFARPDDSDSVVLKEDRICLLDFEGNYYEVDYKGKCLFDRPKEN